MRNHQVKFVADDAMPPGMDWAMCQQGERHVLFVKESADVRVVMCETWTAFHRSLSVVPAPRSRQPYTVSRGRRVALAVAAASAVAATVAGAWATGVLASMQGFPLWATNGATIATRLLQL